MVTTFKGSIPWMAPEAFSLHWTLECSKRGCSMLQGQCRICNLLSYKSSEYALTYPSAIIYLYAWVVCKSDWFCQVVKNVGALPGQPVVGRFVRQKCCNYLPLLFHWTNPSGRKNFMCLYLSICNFSAAEDMEEWPMFGASDALFWKWELREPILGGIMAALGVVRLQRHIRRREDEIIEIIKIYIYSLYLKADSESRPL